MRKVLLALVLTGLISTLSEVMAPTVVQAADRRCATWGASHHMPGYRDRNGRWVPPQDIPGPCTRWESTKDKRDAQVDEAMDRFHRQLRDASEREREFGRRLQR